MIVKHTVPYGLNIACRW